MARPEDLPRILAIESSSHVSPWSSEAFLSEMMGTQAHQRMWVVSASRGPGGIAAYECFHYLVDQVYILNFTVAEPFRRKGLGKALLSLVLFWAERHGCDSVVLDVRSDNSPAIGLYVGAGFKKTGESKSGAGVPFSWRMLKRLTQERSQAFSGGNATT